jgi:DNA-binding NarL/FixJ family response regulator
MRGHLHSVDAQMDADASHPRPIRVVLADDHAALRRSLRLLLDREKDMRVVGEAGDLETALWLVAAQRPAVIVLDLRMPSDGSAVERIRRLRERFPRTEIVITTMHENRAFADQILKAGAMAFVLKDRADVDLCDGVRSAALRLRYTSPGLGRP